MKTTLVKVNRAGVRHIVVHSPDDATIEQIKEAAAREVERQLAPPPYRSGEQRYARN